MAFTIGTATFTNGSTSVTSVSLTSGRLSYFNRGTRMVVGTNPVMAEVEAVDAPAVDEITLAQDWPHPSGTYAFLANMTSEGVRDAVQVMRETTEALQAYNDGFNTLLTSTDPTVEINGVEVVPFGYITQQVEQTIDVQVSRVDDAIAQQERDRFLLERSTLFSDFTVNQYRLMDELYGMENVNLSDIWNVERATSGWTFNATGKLVEVPPNMPRLMFNPETGEPEGLLIEEERTNLWPRFKGDGSWGNEPVFTADAVISPRGVQDATLINQVTSAANRYQLTWPSGTFTSGQVLTVRWMQKRIEYTGDPWQYSNGTDSLLRLSSLINLDFSASSESALRKVADLRDGWVYLEANITVIDGSQDTILRLYVIPETEGVTNPFAVFGIQVEAAETGSSPIFTDGNEVTRTADIVSRNLGSEFNPSEGTFVIEFEAKEDFVDSTKIIFSITDGSTDNIFQLLSSLGNRLQLMKKVNSGSFEGSSDTRVDVQPGVNRIAFSLNPNGHSISANGGQVSSVIYNEPLPVNLNRLDIAQRLGAGTVNSTWKIICYQSRAVSSDKLQELSNS